MTAPLLRICPLQENEYKKRLNAILSARHPSGCLQVGDLAPVLDDGKPGNKRALLAPFSEGGKADSDDEADLEDDNVAAATYVRPCFV